MVAAATGVDSAVDSNDVSIVGWSSWSLGDLLLVSVFPGLSGLHS